MWDNPRPYIFSVTKRMPLLSLTNVSLAFGTHVLFDKIELTVHRGQRTGILGRNGAGKSTFMKMLDGQHIPDSGKLWIRPGIKVGYLTQDLPDANDATVYDVVSDGLAEVGALLKEYHHLIMGEFDEASMTKLTRVQDELEAKDGWSFGQKIDAIIEALDLPADTPMKSLSGGWRRRVAMARVLVSDPDLLLLDEPTNHLDIPTIYWLEKQLESFRGALMLVTHDRAFLQRMSTSIIEIDRGNLRYWDGDYQGFLRLQAEQLAAEETANSLFDKRLAQEEIWIRQGVKARRTRNEGRVRDLKKMRDERGQRRERQGKANFAVETASRSGKIVVEVENLSKTYDGQRIVKDFSTCIMRGDRIGFIGANGMGKSTLLKLLLGQVEPDAGSVKIGTKMELAYFDQLRDQLDLDKTVIENMAEGREFITINGKDRHVISYLQDFMFTPERTRQPVKALSGGEQNRLILARLFSKPANILVLDEPTNDLDMETLELLEEILLEFNGTILLVSHDREFLDNVVTSCIVFEGDGVIKEYVGGYADFIRHGGTLPSLNKKALASK
ncbi:MAG: ATP-binding cassette subfamily F protein uup [Oleiphilaceae bacterium]